MLALLASNGGSQDLVGLLQFAWKDAGASSSTDDSGSWGSGGGGGSGGGAGANAGNGGGVLPLSDTLLGKPRLLRRFLEESVATMEALAEEVGDCRRHEGYPGPAELASTLARLATQRRHTVERLAAWGVLRQPPGAGPGPGPASDTDRAAVPLAQHAQPGPAQQQPASPGPGSSAGLAQQRGSQASQASQSQVPAASPGPQRRPQQQASPHARAGDAGASQGQGDPQDPDFALALAIQLSLQEGGAPAPASPAAGGVGTPVRAPRAQRTPPRPTGGVRSGGGGGGEGAERSPSSRGMGTWPGPSPARSPGGATRGESRTPQSRAAAVGSSLESPPAPAAASHPAPTSIPVGNPLPEGEASLSSLELLTEAAGDADAGLTGQQPLAVADAAAAAAALPDACVLVDAGAVAALAGGLRERVEALVAQLVQVQQRRGRLEHACRHGILAGGRKLLLLCLQLLWEQARHATASAAVSAAVAAVTSPAPAPPVPSTSAPEAPGARTPPGPGPSPQPPSQPSSTQHPTRRPRYEGRLAELAAGLGEEDTTVEQGFDDAGLGDLGFGVVSSLGLSSGEEEALREGREGGGGLASRIASRIAALGGRAQRQRESAEVAADAAAQLRGSQRWRRRAALEAAAEAAPPPARDDPSSSASSDDGAAGDRASRQSEGSGPDDDEDGDFGDEEGWDAAGLGGTGRLEPRSRSLRETLRLASLSSSVSLPPPPGPRRAASASVALPPGLAAAAGLDGPATLRASTAASGAGPVATSNGGVLAGETIGGRGARRARAPEPGESAFSGRGHGSEGLGSEGLGPGRRDLGASFERAARRLAAARAQLAAGAVGGSDASRAPEEAQAFGLGAGGGCSCGAECEAERSEQAQQLRALQRQLARCQASQSDLQKEVGRLLDMLSESRRTGEQALAASRRELSRLQAEPSALAGLGPEELAELAAKLEGSLSRVRAAQLQAAAERDLLCPVCWEARKGLVFGCGHQTCCACGDKLALCPICRVPVSLRIRVYS
ncbi:hypothetical protein HYH03_006052 [Edaphochlamys debaryana]|uniref:RING-type domain-containing protein n=1 Tax=Edaphochlamys debaryana TaxID=47281 RepID=A0A835Y497_9CHLO|nr:hypothetical protein HYH03_006052 [Edaphochlamys debaryana]|eukprot:KAG2495810.1 hypothetical protein HYH03_006052 [Edaphochlamys debaryana]